MPMQLQLIFLFFFLSSLMWGGVKTQPLVSCISWFASSRLHEKERSLRRSRDQGTSVTHLVQCPYLRVVSAESSEIPVEVDPGRLASWRNLFTSGLGPSYVFDYLHLSICSFLKNGSKAQRRPCKGKMGCKWSAGLLYRNFLHFYLVFARKSSASVLLWIGGATRAGLFSCICRSSTLILSGVLSLLTPSRTRHKKQDWLCGRGWPPSVVSAGLSVLLHTKMQIWPQASSLCSPTFSLKLTSSASWAGNSERKAGSKGVSSFPPGGFMLYCLVSWGNSTKFSTKVEGKSHFSHRYPLSV